MIMLPPNRSDRKTWGMGEVLVVHGRRRRGDEDNGNVVNNRAFALEEV